MIGGRKSITMAELMSKGAKETRVHLRPYSKESIASDFREWGR